MNNIYGYDSEAFDISTNAEMNKNKSNKKFKMILLVSIVLILLAITIIFMLLYKKKTNVEMIDIKQDITASGEYFYGERNLVTEHQREVVKNKTTYLILKKHVDNNGYISNKSITVYKDGTYLIDYEQAYNGKYKNNRIMGNIDLSMIDEYIDENKEILLKMEQYDYENDNDPFVDILLINIDGTYVFGYSYNDSDEKFKDELENVFENSFKEEVEDFDLTNE